MISIVKKFTIHNTNLLSHAQLPSFREIRLTCTVSTCFTRPHFELKQHFPTYLSEENNYIIIKQNSDSLPHLMLLDSSILISLRKFRILHIYTCYVVLTQKQPTTNHSTTKICLRPTSKISSL